jgi:hypothetical protein
MNREELIERFLRPSEIKIEESDYEFLSLFTQFKIILDKNKDKELYYGDLGNDYNTLWTIYYYNGNNRIDKLSEKVLNSIIKDKIMELYPYTEEELDKINKNKRYTPNTMAPGKHRGKTWKEVKLLDPNYVQWMLNNTKDKKLKDMLISL